MTENDPRIGVSINNCTPIKLIRRDNSHRRYQFECGHCGKLFEALFNNVQKGNTKSCGCQRSKYYYKTHGLTNTKIYMVWRGILGRCYWPKHISFKNYGGRGIRVCDRWHKFENFYADMGEPVGKQDIDRIDNNGHYELSNCRWINRKQNIRNSPRTIKLMHENVEYTIEELALKFKLHPRCLKKRIRMGWTLEDSLTRKVRQNRPKLKR